MKTVFARSGRYPDGRALVGALAPAVPPVVGNPGSESGQAPPPAAIGDRRSSFTLIELLAVVVIIILLAGLVAGLGVYSQRKAKMARAQGDIAILGTLIEGYRNDRGAYPTSTEARVSLVWVYEALNSVLLYEQLSTHGYAQAVMNLVRPI